MKSTHYIIVYRESPKHAWKPLFNKAMSIPIFHSRGAAEYALKRFRIFDEHEIISHENVKIVKRTFDWGTDK